MRQEFSNYITRHNIAQEKEIHESEDSINMIDELQPINSETSATIQIENSKLKPLRAGDDIPKLENNPVFRDREIKRAQEEKKELNSIKKIFRSGSIDEIMSFLQEEETDNFIFNKEIAKIKKKYERELVQAEFLSRKDWKILAGIELCNKKTFEHSIGTYLVVRKKIEERMMELGPEIINEGVKLEQLYRACLFHDIGKLAIPEFILNNETTYDQWVFYFMDLSEDDQDEILVENKIIIPDNIRHNLGSMTEFFSKSGIRAVRLVPMKTILSDEQKELLINNGLDPEDSLGDIMQTHEAKSEDILRKLGFPIEALLAGNHHNYKHADKKMGEKPTALSALHISIEIASNILHLADVQNALNAERSYHHKEPMLRIMAFLIDDAEKGVIEPTLTARWIEDELKKMSPGYLNEIRNMTAKHQHHNYLQKRNEEILLIDDFLLENLPENKHAHEEENERLSA